MAALGVAVLDTTALDTPASDAAAPDAAAPDAAADTAIPRAGSRLAVLFESGAPLSHARALMAVASTSIGKRIDHSSRRMASTRVMRRVKPKHVACHRATTGKPVDRASKKHEQLATSAAKSQSPGALPKAPSHHAV
jgi:hypothetical protein